MLDWNFIFNYSYLFIDGIIITLEISFFGIVFATFVGFLCSIVVFFPKAVMLNRLVSLYVEVARNTPLLIWLFFLYFALPKVNLTLEPKICAIIGLAFLGGGYMCESFRLGLQSIAKHQIESALSIGLNTLKVIWYVIIPQALGVAMPSLAANVIFLIKETSVISILALADILYISKDIINMYGKTYEALFMLLCAYLVILLPLSVVFSILERHIKKRL